MFAIMRVEKRKRAVVYGLQIENNRTADDHKNGRDFERSAIDWDKTDQNNFAKDCKCENWNKAITEKIKTAGVKERSNSVVLLDGLYTASPEWFVGKTKQEINSFFADCFRFHKEHYGTIINAVIHWDETTPHLHIASVPLTQGEKGVRLSADSILGNRNDFRRRQDEFYEAVGKKRGLERGLPSADKKRYLSVQDYKIRQNNAKIEAQGRLINQGNVELQEINKKRLQSLTDYEKATKDLTALHNEFCKTVGQVEQFANAQDIFDWCENIVNQKTGKTLLESYLDSQNLDYRYWLDNLGIEPNPDGSYYTNDGFDFEQQ